MRFFLAATLAVASTAALSAQAPTAIREVAALIELRTHRGATYPVFKYEGVFVLGDVSLKDFNDATSVVQKELRGGEQIVSVFASQQVPGRENQKDLSVQTCVGRCGKGVKTADGKIEIAASGDSGRYFVFEREAGKLQLHVVWNWID